MIAEYWTYRNKENEYKLTNMPKYAIPVNQVCTSVIPTRIHQPKHLTGKYKNLPLITSLHSNTSSS